MPGAHYTNQCSYSTLGTSRGTHDFGMKKTGRLLSLLPGAADAAASRRATLPALGQDEGQTSSCRSILSIGASLIRILSDGRRSATSASPLQNGTKWDGFQSSKNLAVARESLTTQPLPLVSFWFFAAIPFPGENRKFPKYDLRLSTLDSRPPFLISHLTI